MTYPKTCSSYSLF